MLCWLNILALLLHTIECLLAVLRDLAVPLCLQSIDPLPVTPVYARDCGPWVETRRRQRIAAYDILKHKPGLKALVHEEYDAVRGTEGVKVPDEEISTYWNVK